MSGKRIVDGLAEALAGDLSSVTIDGVIWIRESDADALVAEARREERERAATLVEDHGHSGGRIRGSHKHLAAAIRALEDKA